jgi:uncharacterized protein (TIGR03437 family)
MTVRKTLAITFAIAAISCFEVSNKLAAATAPIITYTASGTFASTATSGADTLKLAGEPFSVTIAASAASEPSQHGSNWAAFNKLKMTGTVHSGLLGATPVTIASAQASIIQAIDPGKYDSFTMEAPVNVVGISLIIKAVVIMPFGTIGKPLLSPFKAVTLAAANATVTYADGSNDTVLAIQTGALSATIPSGSQVASAVVLHSAGAQSVTLHDDGTESVRSLGVAPVDLGMSTDAVTLKFYAYGVGQASEVHMQIDGEEVPVVYAGASGYYRGLDEIVVQAPRSLAGRGSVDVALTADGQTADPVHIHIQ